MNFVEEQNGFFERRSFDEEVGIVEDSELVSQFQLSLVVVWCYAMCRMMRLGALRRKIPNERKAVGISCFALCCVFVRSGAKCSERLGKLRAEFAGLD
jgi:hypothetical protein